MYPVPVPPPPAAPRAQRGVRVLLAVLLPLVLLAGLCDLAQVQRFADPARFVVAPAAGPAGLAGALRDRATAVLAHDEKTFLAGVDPDRPSLVERQRTEYRNLLALGLSTFQLTATSTTRYPAPARDAELATGFSDLTATAVTVRYAIGGLDNAPVAEPWIPVYGQRQGHWLLVDEVTTGDLPTGAGGLPWQGGPITVRRTAHVTAVLSTDDQSLAGHLLALAERGVSRVLRVHPSAWTGRVLVTAVSDETVFRAYFRDDPEQVRQVAAIAVPTLDAVDEWSGGAHYVTTRVLFNPDTFGDGDDELQHTFTHEFTHAAMGALTESATPAWLVEGIAEYVAFSSEGVGDALATRLLSRIAQPTALPADTGFYHSADNYVLGWLACRRIAQKYGAAKLFRLYAYFHDHAPGLTQATQDVLGVSSTQFATDWLGYLRQLRH